MLNRREGISFMNMTLIFIIQNHTNATIHINTAINHFTPSPIALTNVIPIHSPAGKNLKFI